MATVWWEAGIDVHKQAIQFLACVNSSHSSFRRSQPEDGRRQMAYAPVELCADDWVGLTEWNRMHRVGRCAAMLDRWRCSLARAADAPAVRSTVHSLVE